MDLCGKRKARQNTATGKRLNTKKKPSGLYSLVLLAFDNLLGAGGLFVPVVFLVPGLLGPGSLGASGLLSSGTFLVEDHP